MEDCNREAIESDLGGRMRFRTSLGMTRATSAAVGGPVRSVISLFPAIGANEEYRDRLKLDVKLVLEVELEGW